jgi:REP element-mobilizing transposase RayT
MAAHHVHAHLLVSIPAKLAVAEFVGRVKANTSTHMNDSRDAVLDFYRQGGYGVLSISSASKQITISHIENQTEHHRVTSFQDEFVLLLDKQEIEYDEKHTWE